jgi:VWFA-related protein
MTRAVALLLAAVSGVVAASTADLQNVFTSRTTVVRVDVAVTRQGKPVTGLLAADFEVRDNGMRQTIDFLGVEQVPLSLALAIDVSGSVAGDRFEHLRRATDQAITSLRPRDRAGLITFSHIVAVRTAPTTDRMRLRLALEGPAGSGGTALVDASYAGLLLSGDAGEHRNVAIVFSDGLETMSWLTPSAVIDAAKRIDVVVCGVTAGGPPRVSFLGDLAAATGGSLLEIESTEALGQAFASILDAFRQRYLLSYTPRGVAPDGWHRLDVRVNRRGVTVKARPGYMAR